MKITYLPEQLVSYESNFTHHDRAVKNCVCVQVFHALQLESLLEVVDFIFFTLHEIAFSRFIALYLSQAVWRATITPAEKNLLGTDFLVSLDWLWEFLASFGTSCHDCCNLCVINALQIRVVFIFAQLLDLLLIEQLAHLKSLYKADLVLF